MIRVRHNGTELLAEPEAHGSVADLIDWSCEENGREGEIVLRVAADGQTLDPEVAGGFDGIPVAGISELDLETQEARLVALSSLASAREFSDQVCAELVRTAGLFRDGRTEDANHLFADVLDALSVLVFAIGTGRETLGAEGSPLAGVEEEVQPWLNQLLEAQRIRDWVCVSDYLEYEIGPILADWGRRIDGICGGASATVVERGHA